MDELIKQCLASKKAVTIEFKLTIGEDEAVQERAGGIGFQVTHGSED